MDQNNEMLHDFSHMERVTQQLHEELQQLFQETLRAHGDALSARDPRMGEHCRRTALLAELCGSLLGLEEDRLRNLQQGALLHDIGIIGVSQAQLLQPISYDEPHPPGYQRHIAIGDMPLRPAHRWSAIIPIVCHHHENWDGTGYPDGLSGEAIPYEARIVAVVNVFDRLTRGPYVKRLYSEEEAMGFLKIKAGKMFDPTVVQAFAANREQGSSAG